MKKGIVIIVLCGVCLIWGLYQTIDSIRKGEINYRGTAIKRRDDPIQFWIMVSIAFGFAIFALSCGVVILSQMK